MSHAGQKTLGVPYLYKSHIKHGTNLRNNLSCFKLRAVTLSQMLSCAVTSALQNLRFLDNLLVLQLGERSFAFARF